ncbi:MAG: hypothetical protein AB8I69_17465 [Anaerolineae bacterium]|jgi:hypothetical protein
MILEYVLAICSWVSIGLLIFFLWRIAYFYQKTSGQRVGYYLLIVAALLLTGGAVWYLVADVGFTGEPAADLLLFGGGILIFVFGGRLQELMTGERR